MRRLGLATVTLLVVIVAGYAAGLFWRTIGDSRRGLAKVQPTDVAPPLPGNPMAVTLGKELLHIGVISGRAERDPFEFGLIEDVASFADGRFVVLDSRKNEAGVFTSSGEYVQTLGRPGRGPGELAVPKALTILEPDTVLVLDPGNRRITQFPLGVSTPSHSYAVDFDARDLCVVHGSLVLLGLRNGAILHELAPASAQVLRSFGEPFGAQAGLIADTFSDGILACNGAMGVVVVASRWLGEVRAYQFDGQLRWRRQIPDFVPVEVLAAEGGGIKLRHPTGATGDYVASAVFLSDSLLLVQYGPKVKGERLGLGEVKSAVISVTDGSGGRAKGLLEIVAEGGRRDFIVSSDPFPQVSIVEPLMIAPRAR